VLIRRWFREAVVDDPRLGRRRKMTPVELGLVQSVLGGVMIGVLALLLERGPGGLPVLPATPEGWLAVSWLGLLGSGVAYLLFFHLIAAWGATRTTLVTYIMPPVGILLGVVVLRESMDLRVIVGTALIIGGIALVNSRFGQRRLYGRATAVPAQER
jgi:drug/metabolite transporter (DMT)-like permease